jgi:hypothetical protein
LNLRPSGYEPDELPDCSTPHQEGRAFYRRICCSAIPKVAPQIAAPRLLWRLINPGSHEELLRPGTLGEQAAPRA